VERAISGLRLPDKGTASNSDLRALLTTVSSQLARLGDRIDTLDTLYRTLSAEVAAVEEEEVVTTDGQNGSGGGVHGMTMGRSTLYSTGGRATAVSASTTTGPTSRYRRTSVRTGARTLYPNQLPASTRVKRVAQARQDLVTKEQLDAATEAVIGGSGYVTLAGTQEIIGAKIFSVAPRFTVHNTSLAAGNHVIHIPQGKMINRLLALGDYTIHSITQGNEGQLLILLNSSVYNMTLVNRSTIFGADANGRIVTGTGTDTPNSTVSTVGRGSAMLCYDNNLWHLISLRT